MRSTVWQTKFSEAREAAGVKGITPHSLRHLYASALIAGGESVVTVQKRLGHASPTETLTTYGHLWPDADDTTRAAVRSHLGAVLERDS